MSNKIYLIDLNGNHTIPVENDACIGREHLQNCEDKRISRKHAIFTIEADKITITATHTNPLFYRTKLDNSLKSLLKNSIVQLQESDEVGFLPDKFWFRISSTKLDNDTNQINDLETQELDLNENIADPNIELVLPMIRIKNAAEINQLSSTSEVAESSGNSQKSKRPSWMLDENYAVGSSSNKKQKPNVAAEENEVQSTVPNISDQVKDDVQIAIPSVSEGLEDEVESTISVRDIPDEPDNLNDSTDSQPLVNFDNEVSGNNVVPTSTDGDADVESKDDIKVAILPSSSDSPDGNDAASSSTAVPITPQVPAVKIKNEVKVEPADSSSIRDSCQFGIKCYRRNPAHLREFAHPGDSDYRRPNFPPAPPTAPPCQYGNACYRRNPVHFQTFQHPPSTNPKMNRQKLRKKNLDSGDSQMSTSNILGSKRDRKKIILNLDYGLSDEDESDPFDDTDDDTEFVPTDDDLPDTEDTPIDDD